MEEICCSNEHQNSLEILYLILMKRRLTLLLFLLSEKTEKIVTILLATGGVFKRNLYNIDAGRFNTLHC